MYVISPFSCGEEEVRMKIRIGDQNLMLVLVPNHF